MSIPKAIDKACSDIGSDWNMNPHGISLGRTFSTAKEAIDYAESAGIDVASAQDQVNMKKMLSNMPEHLNTNGVTDTTVGGNDAVNCHWQFCRNDDIVHPAFALKNTKTQGLGRVYNEMYESNQQLLWLTFGVPRFNNMRDFYVGAADSETSALMNKGEVGLGYTLGKWITTVGILAISIPFLPIIGMYKLAGMVASWNDRPITKFYDFRPTTRW